MVDLYIGVATYGNLKYTKLAIKSIIDGTTTPFKLLVISDNQGDGTKEWCNSQGIYCKQRQKNWGFPSAINDLYDIAWNENPNANVIIMGNDVMAFPGSIDNLVLVANSTEYEWISGVAVLTPRKFVRKFPQYRNKFDGNFNLIDENFYVWKEAEPPMTGELADLGNYGIIGDSHNLCLFKRSIFDKIGYVDVNFYPAYYEDNDYARRAQLSGAKLVRTRNSPYFHFWSRTIHEAGMKKTNDKYFPL
ncbi:MAG TPA: glycosyltransferase, partial [Candidatus Dojkabacteria bacterium]